MRTSAARLRPSECGLEQTIPKVQTEQEMLERLTVRHPVRVLTPEEAAERVALTHTGSRLESIRARNLLRVGYHDDSIPFAYRRADGSLAGYDIEMAHKLARSLDVDLTFVPFQYHTLIEDLQADRFDIGMSAITMTYERLREIDFTDSYLQLHIAFVVSDHQRRRFKSQELLLEYPALKIAAIQGSALIPKLREYLPDAEMIEVESRQIFFDDPDVADALLSTAEQGAAWTLRHPYYSVVIPEPSIGDDFLSYAIKRGDVEFLNFVNQWLVMNDQGEEAAQAYRYWILGQVPSLREPRWSIMRDLLGWGEEPARR